MSSTPAGGIAASLGDSAPDDATEIPTQTEPADAADSSSDQAGAPTTNTTDDEPGTDVEPDADRWRRFAESADESDPEPPPPVGRLAAARVATMRVVRHEWFIAAAVSVLLAVAMTWPVLADPTETIPHDLGDPLLITYLLAWSGHAIWNNPIGLWDTNGFYPDVNSYAFTDTFLGYAPASLIGGGHEAALLRYNLLYVATFALAFFACYALMRQLGARTAGSAVAAAAFAYAPWKLAQAGHLQVLSVGGIALALAMLARGHGWSLTRGYRANRTRPGWVIAGWIVATWQVTIGFGMGVPFGYFLAGTTLVAGICWLVKGRPSVPRWVLAADAGGMVFFAGVSLALAVPYFRAIADHPEAVRSLDYVDYFSPTWASFLISPGESTLWGDAHAPAREGLLWPPETTLLLGFTLIALAVAGLVWSVWSRRQRVFIAVGIAVSVILALGTNFLDDGEWGYALLFQYLPGFDGLRTPGRLVVYTTLLLCLLTAGTLSHLASRMDGYAAESRVDPRWRLRVPAPMRAALFLPMLLVLAEGVSSAEVPTAPEAPVRLADVDQPILVLPSDGGNDPTVQFWSVDGFPRMVNGAAGFVPTAQEQIRFDALSFPSASSIAALREAGIASVVVVVDRLEGTPWEHVLDLPRTDPTVTVTDLGAVVIFTL
ncbi:hypothetical protein [Stackebrandtia soli]|uniref:hypothetical protein n=1 Tax=Stackebrandtia soli TaxID=1892856 RepID=UPI0039E7D254